MRAHVTRLDVWAAGLTAAGLLLIVAGHLLDD